MLVARAEAKILALEQNETQARADRQEFAKVKQELADLLRLNTSLEAEKAAAEKASAEAVASAAAEQKRALASQEQVTAIARELEEVATRTAQQVEAAQEEGRQLRQRADAADVAKEMVRVATRSRVLLPDGFSLPSQHHSVPMQALAHAAEADRDREALRRSLNLPASLRISARAGADDQSDATERMEVSPWSNNQLSARQRRLIDTARWWPRPRDAPCSFWHRPRLQ